MSTPTHEPQLTVMPITADVPRDTTGATGHGRFGRGFVAALLGHVISVGPLFVVGVTAQGLLGLPLGVDLEALLLGGLLVVGFQARARGDIGLCRGLLIGWVSGLAVIMVSFLGIVLVLVLAPAFTNFT